MVYRLAQTMLLFTVELHTKIASIVYFMEIYQKTQRKVIECWNCQDGFAVLGCLAIKAVRKNVSAGQLLPQTNPAQSKLFQHQLHFWGINWKCRRGLTPYFYRITKKVFRFAMLAKSLHWSTIVVSYWKQIIVWRHLKGLTRTFSYDWIAHFKLRDERPS